jgi:hypothetical protein
MLEQILRGEPIAPNEHISTGTGLSRADPLVARSGGDVATSEPTDTELVKAFESLGHGCEFGIVQRFAGAEPLGLLRFSSARPAAFLRAIRSGFEGIEDPANLEIFEDDRTGEWFGRVTSYDFEFHTGHFVHDISIEAVSAEQGKRLALLRRLLMEQLQIGRRIFVRFGGDDLSDAIAISAAIAERGPGTLLWVTLATDDRPAGTVERLGPNLLRGTIDRFWVAVGRRFDVQTTQWLSVCRNAHHMVHRDQTITLLPRPPKVARPNCLSKGVRRTSPVAQSFDLPDGGRAHVLTTETAFPNSFVESMALDAGPLRPKTVHVFAVDVWIGADFTGRSVVPVFVGLHAIQFVAADLARRDQWQTVWVTAKTPVRPNVLLGLSAEGPSGACVFTRNWRLEEGASLDD